MKLHLARIATPAAALIALTGAATAHTGHGETSGFVHGFIHPVGGLDHVLAMVAVGLYAALLGGRALWLVPASFVGVMVFGGTLGMAGATVPYTELGITLSVVVLGLAVALRPSIPTLAAMGLVGFFAVFHGYAHGAEMPQDASGSAYAAGFVLATALLHSAGIALGLLVDRISQQAGPRLVQVGGGAIALAGVVILIHTA